MVDYKQKYLEIRNILIKSVDIAYRQGYEMGTKDAQLQQMQQMQDQQAAMAEAQGGGAAAMYGPQGGAPIQGEVPKNQKEDTAESQDIPNVGGLQIGSQNELDQHIQSLENIVSKGEQIDLETLKKSIESLKNYSSSLKSKKNQSISLPPRVSKVLSPDQKTQLSMQEMILNNVLEKWEKESRQAASDITSTLTGILKKHEH